MTKETTIITVKARLNIVGASRDLLISDIYDNALSYLNLAELPDELEPLIRAKVKRVIDYEASFGDSVALDVVSQTEGKCSWTYSTDENSGRDAVYGFSSSDFKQLRRFRKTRK